MKFFNFFHVPKHKQFKYYPRYYDEEHEELLERVRRAQGSSGEDIDNIKARISQGFGKRGHMISQPRTGFRRKEVRKSNRLLVYVFLVLVLLTFIFLY